MFDFLFNPQGRISRKGMWLGYFLPYFAISFVLGLLGEAATIFGVLGTVVGLFYLWPSMVAVPVKRLHDHGRSGWWLLGYYGLTIFLGILFGAAFGGAMEAAGFDPARLAGMPQDEQMALFVQYAGAALRSPLGIVAAVGSLALGLFFFVFLFVAPGQRSDNRFGRDPLADGRGYAD